jgi:arylsulfatase A-like enzyme
VTDKQEASVERRPISAAIILVIALGAAFATGYLEVGIIQFQRLVLGQLAYESLDVIWMAPLSNAFFALAPALLLSGVALVRPQLVTRSHVVFVFTMLVSLAISWLLLGARLHPIAHVVVAAGAARVMAGLRAIRSHHFDRNVMRGTAVLAAITALLAISMPGGRALAEKIRVARLPDAEDGVPNVVLIIWDTARRQNLSLYGYPRPTTPKLEQWAKRGVVFERALTTSSWTLPSHASMFTGRLTQELSTGWRTPLDDRFPTLAEELRARGYYTAGFVANVMAASRESGLHRGFIRYEDFQISIREVLRSSAGGKLLWRYIPFHNDAGSRHLAKKASTINADFLDWQQNTKNRPFFAFLNYYDAHDPYYAPPAIRQRFRSGRGDIDRYDASLSVLDDHLDRLLRELQRRDVLRNTIVILSSDHGELFGEKGLTRHGNSLYFPLLDVPLVIWPAGETRGARISNAVSMRDLPRTILQAVTGANDTTFPGRSLSRYWAAQTLAASEPDTLVSGIGKGVRTPPEEPVTKGNMTALFAGKYQYILNGDGSEELYDVDTDPALKNNLAGNRSAAAALEQFRAALSTHVPAAWTPVMPASTKAAGPTTSRDTTRQARNVD